MVESEEFKSSISQLENQITTRNSDWTVLNGRYIAYAKLNVDMSSHLLYLFSESNDQRVDMIEIPRNPAGMKTFRGEFENGVNHSLSLENGIDNGSSMNVWTSQEFGFRFLLEKSRTNVRLFHKVVQTDQEIEPTEVDLRKIEVVVVKNNNLIIVKKAENVRKVFQCEEVKQSINISQLTDKEKTDLRMIMHALNVQTCQSFCKIHNAMVNQSEDPDYPVCDHQIIDSTITVQDPLEVLSAIRSYMSELPRAKGKKVYVMTSEGTVIDSLMIDATLVKNSIRNPFKSAQMKIGQVFDFRSENVYVTIAKKSGQLTLPIYMDSAKAAKVVQANGFHYVNSDGFTSLCDFENIQDATQRLKKVPGLGVKALQSDEGYWLFLAPVPGQQRR